ncbi:UDP-N-acetylmuramate dehydrogenase [Pseudomonas sp. gcc21]|uniref:UDP-N-acetylmuramate dehydrogenase n=1 Tax=Pseudomonas sp. gcc21 TaxID=2726989 RepID=UPI0014511494|nr:UDP-N-acetylmuramate dehydrogenase [Pseudomonas sp. gcc21]QJD58491.1 UDP-N-acetylmuramate dehydrogenase [Pseudomonas sp. gcc21]
MLDIINNADLRTHNTFGISEHAERLVFVENDRQLLQALSLADKHAWPVTLLGGGSNLVLAGPVRGLVLAIRSRGRRVVSRSGREVIIEAEAGENWHALVNWSLDLGLCGLENLSLIPGTAGAAPVQNIGAYGVELEDVFESVEVYDRCTGDIRRLHREHCRFAYRDSLFKQEPGRYIILRLRLRLSSVPDPKLGYGPLANAWQATGLQRADARVVSELVCQIRQSKLPDPSQLANAGSFFKNPLVTAEQAEALQQCWPGLPSYMQPDGRYKLAAGWLIEQAGWKGSRDGDAGVHREQALVLVNYGRARGEDIMGLATRIQTDIRQRFGVSLEMEPIVLGL